MTPLIERFIGIILIIGAFVGLAVNVYGLIVVPSVNDSVQQTVQTILTQYNQTLISTSDSLKVVDSSLDNAQKTLNLAVTTTHDVAQAIEDTTPFLDTIRSVTGQNLPVIVNSTQQSLDAAGQGAETMEIVLGTLNSVPLLNLPKYEPEIPLHQSLNDISKSLDLLSESFVQLQDNVEVGAENLALVTSDINDLADTLAEIDKTITEGKTVNNQFQQVVKEQQQIMQTLQTDIVAALTWATRAISIILASLIIVFVGLLWQGFQMLRG